MKNMLLQLATAVGLLLVLATPAQGGVGVDIDGDVVSAEITLGGIGADLTLTFEDVEGLSEEDLGLTASLLGPLDLPGILSRLPSLLTSLPTGFPLLLTIDPPSNGDLEMTGVAELELYTTDLTLGELLPLRLFKAEPGGPFRDVTEYAGTGSYRVRSSQPSFSQFLIVVDMRSAETVAGIKLDRLRDLLDDYETDIDNDVFDELDDALSDAETELAADDYEDAITAVEAFAALVISNSGEDVPDAWSASGSDPNVAGELRAAAATLLFSLGEID
jgi:hypothetical protein